MTVSASALRQNIYKILDEILATGEPVTINRKGKILTILPPKKKSIFDNMVKRDIMTEDPEYYVHLDWSHEWKP